MTIRTRVLILNYHQWLDGGWLWFMLMLSFPIPVSSIYHQPSWVGGCASKRGICNGTFAHLPGIDNKRAFHLQSIPHHRPRRRRQAAQLSSIMIQPSFVRSSFVGREQRTVRKERVLAVLVCYGLVFACPFSSECLIRPDRRAGKQHL